ncbi:hypothetical protein J8M20_00260 [Pseudoalteromonas luteoviolacea]|uniref:hypothetical protein n=1 Tax=Pseudoalteromonas luteoviolacea TaxID=43657 RepID=UPI001B37077C|nr:hypothetical protein [Pseudoalteromonas luteoviolacea]MBQ4809743.1 hypothetical protein [Pseudoalteromonas luteoviolacea]
MKSISTPWKKSRTFGDIYGGRQRLRLNDNIFQRAHSLQKPSANENTPILIQDNPSKNFFFPISVYEAQVALTELPNNDAYGITHLWLRRLSNSEYKSGSRPLAEFICGSGVRVIILYPFPKSLKMELSTKKPAAKKVREIHRFCNQLQKDKDGWFIQWDLNALRKYYINSLLYHEVGHHVDWYSRHWSRANNKQVEEFANQYAIQKTALTTQVINKLK